MKRRTNATAFAFLAPSLLGFGIFILLPLIGAVALSFFRWDLFHPPQFVGMKNFSSLLGWSRHHGGIVFSDSRVWRYFGNTFFFMLAIPVSIGASLGLAIVLNQKLPGRALFRTVFFVPSVCTGVGTMLLWKFLYNPQFGPVNRLLAEIGINGPAWLESYYWAKPAIMVMNVWAAMGGTNMILYLAALQNVPAELYEAAQIDGAGTWRQFVHVTVPTLGPTTFFITTIAIIEGFQGEFDSAYIMTRGGPDGATTTLSYYIFQHAFEWFNVGYACSIAVVLLVLVCIVTSMYWYVAGRTVNYG